MQETAVMQARVTRAFRAAATAGALAAAGLTGFPALASAAPQATVRFAVSLSAVSCPSQAWCMAVGSYTTRSGVQHAVAQFWDSTTWRVLKPPGTSLVSVSCSSATLCLADGGPTGTEQWNGRAWRPVSGPPDAVTAPSCAAGPLCMVINGSRRGKSTDFAESWNGRAWRTWWKTGICFGPPGLCALNAVSCGSASTCVAVGSTQYGPLNATTQTNSVIWNGKGWKVSHPPTPGAPAWLNAVSCAAAFCLATGVGFSAIENGYLPIAGAWSKATGLWKDVSPDLGVVCSGFRDLCPGWASEVSCGTASNCMVFGPAGNQAWNGTTWNSVPSVSAGGGSGLLAVSCGGTICMAVGFRTFSHVKHTLAELWDGSNWQILATPGVGQMSAGTAGGESRAR